MCAWGLTIRDLKQLSLNGINFSSISEAKKEHLRKEFAPDWKKWIDQING